MKSNKLFVMLLSLMLSLTILASCTPRNLSFDVFFDSSNQKNMVLHYDDVVYLNKLVKQYGGKNIDREINSIIGVNKESSNPVYLSDKNFFEFLKDIIEIDLFRKTDIRYTLSSTAHFIIIGYYDFEYSNTMIRIGAKFFTKETGKTKYSKVIHSFIQKTDYYLDKYSQRRCFFVVDDQRNADIWESNGENFKLTFSGSLEMNSKMQVVNITKKIVDDLLQMAVK